MSNWAQAAQNLHQKKDDPFLRYVREKQMTTKIPDDVVEALRPFAALHVTRFMTNGCKYDFRLDVAWIRQAAATLAALEKIDE